MPGGNRTANRDLAAAALAAGKTSAEAAAAAQVNERTVANWKTAPGFAARVNELRGQMVAAVAGRLADSMASGADVLRALLGSDAEAIRLRAADRLLEIELKVVELTELQKRVEDLEKRLGEQAGRT